MHRYEMPVEAGAALREFRRVLRPGGVAFVTMPVALPKAREAQRVFHPTGGGHHALFQYLMSEDELRRESEPS